MVGESYVHNTHARQLMKDAAVVIRAERERADAQERQKQHALDGWQSTSKQLTKETAAHNLTLERVSKLEGTVTALKTHANPVCRWAEHAKHIAETETLTDSDKKIALKQLLDLSAVWNDVRQLRECLDRYTQETGTSQTVNTVEQQTQTPKHDEILKVIELLRLPQGCGDTAYVLGASSQDGN